MRKIRMAVAATFVVALTGVGFAVLPQEAEAMDCGELAAACRAVCQVGQTLKLECLY